MTSTDINTLCKETSDPTTFFEVNVSKETFKFNAAHFVTYSGFRERLHGHNYKISVRLLGSRTIGQDGYVIDFGEIKDVAKRICKDLNEYFICPTLSTVLQITELCNDDESKSIQLICEDGAKFIFPKEDCAMLPIAHSTAEELAIYLWGKILTELNGEYLLKRNIHTMEVTCAEAVGQEAVFRMKIPKSQDELDKLSNIRSYIASGDVVARPCPTLKKDNKKCCPKCGK